MRNLRTSLVRLVVTASLALALTSIAAAPAGADDAVTPVIPTPVAQRAIVPVLGSDGRYHAMYELMLTNTTGKPAQLKSVQVLDAADGRRLQTLGAKQMIAGGDLHKLDREPAKDTTLLPESSRLLFVSLSFKSKRAIPRRLTQRFQVTGRAASRHAQATTAARLHDRQLCRQEIRDEILRLGYLDQRCPMTIGANVSREG